MRPGNWTSKEVRGEVKGLEVGTIGDAIGPGNRAAEGEVGEGELVDATIVAGGTRFSFSPP